MSSPEPRDNTEENKDNVKDDNSDTKSPSPSTPDPTTSLETEQSQSSSSSNPPLPPQPQAHPSGDWQAIWSPAHNAYYFYNSTTQQTTWTNPLQPSSAVDSIPGPSSATSGRSTSPEEEASAGTTSAADTPAAIKALYDLQAAAIAQGIDPALAHLDPSIIAGPSNPAAFTYTAKFNSRTGTFAKPDGRDPSHLSEYERAKRMSEFYFDVGAWEKDVETRKAEEEAEGKKRKRPSKKDLERFKEQKRQKKIAKTAWLRS
ncbi:hypothetical protein C8Q75DRAFT_791270 [Abortiporus biennis]|nr:hypothetical protein C8Q75DRAFT_791270 [Abortiporus biennis]